MSNGDQVIFKGKKENKIHGNKEWIIVHNDVEAGTVRTDRSIKNVTKLKESLYLEYGQDLYQFKSFGIGSKTEVYLNDSLIATGERVRGSVYELDTSSEDQTQSEILFMVYILFNYQFGQ
ncbi:hypothetical protein [Virgibacillus sp. DJP39]|uniref:hypothetical protein n=1 Tax=Virgibacillus sp. DJP39 TaxID=3409790 RepID=UPI003BB49905